MNRYYLFRGHLSYIKVIAKDEESTSVFVLNGEELEVVGEVPKLSKEEQELQENLQL